MSRPGGCQYVTNKKTNSQCEAKINGDLGYKCPTCRKWFCVKHKYGPQHQCENTHPVYGSTKPPLVEATLKEAKDIDEAHEEALEHKRQLAEAKHLREQNVRKNFSYYKPLFFLFLFFVCVILIFWIISAKV